MSSSRFCFLLLIAITAAAGACAQRPATELPTMSIGTGRAGVVSAEKQRWVDSVYSALSEDERIGQLFMVAAYSGGKNYNEPLVSGLVRRGQVGGLIFMQGGPLRQAALTDAYQASAKVPLLLGMDVEWGLGMRLDSVPNLPRQMMIGATNDTGIAYRLGAIIAAQCKRLGVHVAFAPVVDVNNNPKNPVINARAFSENKERVARLGTALMQGLQDAGVAACAKHFPGHGDTDVDSHKDLPSIPKTLPQLDSLELHPFRALIAAGVQSMMIAHLEIPALETEPRVPTTLSKNTVTNLLRNQMGFRGLVFTDALNMQGVAKYFPGGEADLRAFEAGADVLLFSENVPAGIAKIKAALQSRRIPGARLEEGVKKILAAKWDAGLRTRPALIRRAGLTADLVAPVLPFRRDATAAAVTWVRGAASSAPLQALRNGGGRVLYVGVNTGGNSALGAALRPTATRYLPKGGGSGADILQAMSGYDAVVIGVHNLAIYPAGNYGLDASQLSFLKNAATRSNAVVAVLGNAYAMAPFCNAPALLVTYESDTVAERIAAEVIMGKRAAPGRLPVTPCAGLQGATGAVSNPQGALPAMPLLQPFSGPAQIIRAATATRRATVDSTRLAALDAYLNRCVADGVFPGCRVLAAKHGEVIYDRSVGRLTYSPTSPAVGSGTLYDVASLTKVLATNLAVMRLWEEGKIGLDKTVGDYLPWTRGTDKAGLRIRDLLLHQAGLVAYIPFWKETVDTLGAPSADYYQTRSGRGFRIEVARDLFLRNDFPDTMWERILQSPLGAPGRYVYSDNDFYFLWGVVEKAARKPMDAYLRETFYNPLGLRATAWGPLPEGRAIQTAPTENDLTFRRRQIQGTVHDQGAAMMGGIAGHAGLFSSAGDVAVIFQMLLNGGEYAGKRYLKKETVQRFTAYGSPASRRGLGWDKPEAAADASVTSDRCSGYTFGHQGFTGTCAWADPATGVVFVFLSNRVYPNANNTAISRLGVRTVVQDRIYEAFGIAPDRGRGALRAQQVASTVPLRAAEVAALAGQ